MSVGDLSSNERGTGARFNDGKPEMNLIPLRILADYAAEKAQLSQLQLRCILAMSEIARFQEGGNPDSLTQAIVALDDNFDAFEDCANVFSYGKKKYSSWNWAKGMDWSVPIGCIARHFRDVMRGETVDAESNLPHVGHIMCNIVMLHTFVETFPEGDDRPTFWRAVRSKETAHNPALDPDVAAMMPLGAPESSFTGD